MDKLTMTLSNWDYNFNDLLYKLSQKCTGLELNHVAFIVSHILHRILFIIIIIFAPIHSDSNISQFRARLFTIELKRKINAKSFFTADKARKSESTSRTTNTWMDFHCTKCRGRFIFHTYDVLTNFQQLLTKNRPLLKVNSKTRSCSLTRRSRRENRWKEIQAQERNE